MEKDGIKNINKILGLSSELFPISLKYEIFAKMLEYDSELTFDDVTVEQYLSEIVKARNTLAHKKLDVCRTQEYILYYDTMRQLEARKCPEDCIEHSENYKISINEWNELRKKYMHLETKLMKLRKNYKKLKRRQISYIINRSMVFLSILQKILFREKTIFPIMIFISII